MGVVMKWLPALLLLLPATTATPQSLLTGAEVTMVYAQEAQQLQVTETLYFDTIQAGQALTCKALLLSDSFHDYSQPTIVLSGKGQTGPITKAKALQSFVVKFAQAQKNGWVQVSYVVNKHEALTEIPLYFTELAAATSAEDFFTCQLQIPKQQMVYFHFPTAVLSQSLTDQGQQLVAFNVPALPSMIKLELAEDVSRASFNTTLIDISVAVVFIVIGVLIYRYRKVLIYG